MTFQSRPYSGLQDLEKMREILFEIKRVYPYSGWHPTDLDWWIFYRPNRDMSDCIRLWEDPDKGCIGWTFTAEEDIYDLLVHPDLRGSVQEVEILTQLEVDISDFIRSKPQPPDATNIVITAFADETARIAVLMARGFQQQNFLTCLAQDVAGDVPQPCLPEGYHFLDAMHERYADKRANVHLSAFSPYSTMTPAHYRHVMTAPNYDPLLDTVVVAPDQRFTSFAIGWVDLRNRLGSFEPVGTRTDMRRKGLGKAVLLEGLRRLKNRGMQEVLVITHDEPEQIAFYESAGFHVVNHIRQYTKNAPK